MELTTIEDALLDRDGSFREVSFEGPTGPGVQRLVDRLRAEFRAVSCHDGMGAESAVGSGEIGRLLLHPGTLHFVFSGGTGLISQLQLWLESEADGSPFVELTFAPEDIQPVDGLGQAFLAWVVDMNQLLEARQFFARYENASWRFGDVGPTSGVFLTSDLK